VKHNLGPYISFYTDFEIYSARSAAASSATGHTGTIGSKLCSDNGGHGSAVWRHPTEYEHELRQQSKHGEHARYEHATGAANAANATYATGTSSR